MLILIIWLISFSHTAKSTACVVLQNKILVHLKNETHNFLLARSQLQSNLINLKSSGLEVLFRIIRSLNYREVDIKFCNPQRCLLSVFLSNIRFGCVKEMTKRDVSFTQPKHMLL